MSSMNMWSKVRKNLLLMPIDSEEKDFTIIENNLLLGNIEFGQNHHSMVKYGITLVIAVYPKNLINLSIQLIPNNCRFHHIDAKDQPNEDLISHFDKCNELIDKELLNDGAVLIFCGAGHSRSVTIMASYLMKKHRISSEEAVERIRSLRRRINPNEGFLAQLQLYEEMDYKLDKRNVDFRVFCLNLLKKQIWNDKYWEDSRMGALKRQFCEPMRSYMNKVSLNEDNPKSEPSVHYKCIECKKDLFEEINVLSFVLNSDKDPELNTCGKLFVEPIKWLTPLLCANKKGVIKCPNCDHILGKFNWKAYNCNCLLHQYLIDSSVIRINKSSVFRNDN